MHSCGIIQAIVSQSTGAVNCSVAHVSEPDRLLIVVQYDI